jgi:hypothetical protein
MLSYYFPEYLIFDDSRGQILNPIEWLWYADLPIRKKQSEFWGRYCYYRRVTRPEDAEVFMIPYFINTYFEKGKYYLIKKAASEAKILGKKIVLWISGDYDFRIPISNVIVIVQGPDIRNKVVVRLAGPVEIKDHFSGWDNLNETVLKKEEKPKIGFVGQAGSNKLVLYFLINLLWGFAFFLRLVSRQPPSLYPHVLLRKKAIKILQLAKGIETEFIVRSKFLGIGASADQQKQYFKNIRENPYTLCLRGTGNFSFRFYDTLCMGRIPVLIDTECILPFTDEINWRDLIVIIPVHEIPQIEKFILDFHKKLSKNEFVERQKALRKIWEKYLEREAYYYELSKQLKRISLSTKFN